MIFKKKKIKKKMEFRQKFIIELLKNSNEKEIFSQACQESEYHKNGRAIKCLYLFSSNFQ